MARKSSPLPVLLLAGCASIGGPDASNPSAYCTPENAFRLGSQSKAYLGACPKETESAFLAGLQRGRALRPSTPAAQPFHEKIDQLEKQLLAAGADAERERIRASLRDAEWWAIHIINNPGTNMP
jgi:Protein of unknown function (DUF2799)